MSLRPEEEAHALSTVFHVLEWLAVTPTSLSDRWNTCPVPGTVHALTYSCSSGISFSPHQDHCYLYFADEATGGPERLNNLPKVTR